jgi:hypothetical protein
LPLLGVTSAGSRLRSRYWQALSTKHRPSSAMWRIVGCHASRSSTVGAHQMSTPFAYIAARSSGM